MSAISDWRSRVLSLALRPLGKLVVAERFPAPSGLSGITVPPPPLAAGPARVIVVDANHHRLYSTRVAAFRPGTELSLAFPPFANGPGEPFLVLLLQPPRGGGMAFWQTRLAARFLATRAAISIPCKGENGGQVEASWQEDGGRYAEGWLAWPGLRAVSVGEISARLKPLPDGRTSFSLFVPGHTGKMLSLRLKTAAGTTTLPLGLPPAPMPAAERIAAEDREKEEALGRFLHEANAAPADILHIGSRVVGSLSTDWREKFPGARRYVGLDVHPGPTVDVVGDCHELARLFGPASFDAVFSGAVLEHLAMPWIVAAEINRVLRPGGLTYHITPESWPIHETPNDFWRFSDEALRLLFGEPFGFEVLSVGMADRTRIYPLDKAKGDLGLPLGFGFASSWVLARKIRDIDASTPASLSELGQRYPRATSA